MKDRQILELREKWNDEAGDMYAAAANASPESAAELRGGAAAFAKCAKELGEAAKSEE